MVPLMNQERYVMTLYLDDGNTVVLTGEGGPLTEFWHNTETEEFTWVNSWTGWWAVRRDAIRCVQIMSEEEFVEAYSLDKGEND